MSTLQIWQKVLTRISARDGISKPTSNSSDLLFMRRIFPSMALARKTFLINFTMGRYDSQAVTIPLEVEIPFESESPIARAAIIDSKPVPALIKPHSYLTLNYSIISTIIKIT